MRLTLDSGVGGALAGGREQEGEEGEGDVEGVGK